MPTFANTIDSNPIYAKRAEEDQNGLNIDQTYAKKSELPTVNDGTLTIQKNGTTVDTFTANSSSNKTVNIEVPTKTSDLTNDSGFITASDIPAQVQSNWNETDNTDPSYIQNKPSIPAAQVNSDWNASSGVAEILNKPSIPTATSDLTNDSGFITASDVPASQEQADWNESDSSDPAYIKNKPSIPAAQVNSDWNASSGVAEILNKPSIPSATSDLTNDSGFITASDVPGAQEQADWNEANSNDPAYIKNKPSIPAAQVNSDWNASSGVAEILNKPSIPTATSDLTNDSGFITASDVPGAQEQADWNESDSSDPAYIKNKPSIPPAQVNSDWNASSGVAEILNKPSIPSKTSDLQNDSGFITSSDIPAQVQSDWTESDTTDPAYIQHKPSIPSKTSDLQNDSGFITSSDIPAQVQSDWNESDSTDSAYIKNKPSIPAAQVNSDWNASSGVAEILNKPTIRNVPDVTSSDNNKVLVSTYADNVGSYSWAQNTFIATYGTTTYAEIKAAIDAGYNVLCLKEDRTYSNSSFAGGIGYIYKYGANGGNIEFNYFQSFPNSNQVNSTNQGIAIVHIWKVTYDNTWTSSTVVVSPKIEASSPLSVSYDRNNRKVTLNVSLGNTLTNSNNAIEVSNPVPDFTTTEDSKVLGVVDNGGTVELQWVDVSDTQVQSDWTEVDNTAASYIQNKPNLATVATSGSYNDLSNTPTIPAAQVNSDWNASSGVAEILNKPTIRNVPAVTSYDDSKVLKAAFSGGVGSYSWQPESDGSGQVEYYKLSEITNQAISDIHSSWLSGKVVFIKDDTTYDGTIHEGDIYIVDRGSTISNTDFTAVCDTGSLITKLLTCTAMNPNPVISIYFTFGTGLTKPSIGLPPHYTDTAGVIKNEFYWGGQDSYGRPLTGGTSHQGSLIYRCRISQNTVTIPPDPSSAWWEQVSLDEYYRRTEITAANVTNGVLVLESRHNSCVVLPMSDAPFTSISNSEEIGSVVIQWTEANSTTLPTVPSTWHAASANPTALTVGKTYQLSLLNNCYSIVEFG